MRARQQLRAPNDVNGNPRRAWAIFDRSGGSDRWAILDVIEEGYAGLPLQLRDVPELPPVNVRPGELRRWLRLRPEPTDDAAFGRRAWLDLADELSGDPHFLSSADAFWLEAARGFASSSALPFPPPDDVDDAARMLAEMDAGRTARIDGIEPPPMR